VVFPIRLRRRMVEMIILCENLFILIQIFRTLVEFRYSHRKNVKFVVINNN